MGRSLIGHVENRGWLMFQKLAAFKVTSASPVGSPTCFTILWVIFFSFSHFLWVLVPHFTFEIKVQYIILLTDK